MRAIDLTPPKVVTTDESTSLIVAAKLMRKHAIGDIVITRGSGRATKPIGVITDRDIVVHGIACDLDLETITAGDLRLRELITIKPDADLTEITAAMNEHGVRRLLVATDSELLGLISVDDVIEAMAELSNNLTGMVARQIEYEQAHILQTKSQENAA
jgi:CBS domain-containing protein